jgi:hypothetical protein
MNLIVFLDHFKLFHSVYLTYFFISRGPGSVEGEGVGLEEQKQLVSMTDALASNK